MGFKKIISKTDKKLLLAVIGILIAVVSLYAAFHEKKPSISMNIITETDVLDVRKPL